MSVASRPLTALFKTKQISLLNNYIRPGEKINQEQLLYFVAFVSFFFLKCTCFVGSKSKSWGGGTKTSKTCKWSTEGIPPPRGQRETLHILSFHDRP